MNNLTRAQEIETMEHSPNLLNFLIYVRALGCRIRIEPEPLCNK